MRAGGDHKSAHLSGLADLPQWAVVPESPPTPSAAAGRGAALDRYPNLISIGHFNL